MDTTGTRTDLLSTEVMGEVMPTLRSLPGCTTRLSHFLRLDAVNEIYSPLRERPADAFVHGAVRQLGTVPSVSGDDLGRIPKEGGVIVVANHPYGMLDGLVLADVLSGVRPDLRILATRHLAFIPELRDMLFLVDPSGGPSARDVNFRGLRQALGWVREGGMLMVFPSGAISRPQLDHGRPRVTDPAWRESIGRLIQRAGVPVVPAFIAGQTSRRFQTAGILDARLRLVLQPRELLRHKDTPVEIRFGHAIAARKLSSLDSAEETVRYLRFRTYLLAERARATPADAATPPPPVPPADDRRRIVDELSGLPADQLLVKSGTKQVFVATAEQIPNTLYEIARQRELTFRAVGEGTGRALDRDAFDDEYLHLFAWDADAQEIIGAYRMGQTDRTIARHGIDGLYSTHRFRTSAQLFERLGPSLELGRSFIQPAYQRQYSSLLLLWKGIGEYVARNPRYRHLYGMVSISRTYQGRSRALMAKILSDTLKDDDLAVLVRPTHPLRARKTTAVHASDIDQWGNSIEELNDWVSDLETTGYGIPVLVRQYSRMGAAFLGFNVDPTFGNSLDGLIVVNLTQTPERQLRRLFGKDAAARITQG